MNPFAPRHRIERCDWRSAKGDAQAQRLLGASYFKGEGVRQDQAEAVKWYRKAAEQGDALAQSLLAASYRLGRGIPQNYTEAVKWYRRAAEQGEAGSQYILGLAYEAGEGVPQRYTEAYLWFSLSAANGDTDAMKSRDDIAQKLTPQALEQAQARATKLHEEIQARKKIN